MNSKEGREAKFALEWARGAIAMRLGVKEEKDLYFTSGGTESNNIAIRSALMRQTMKGSGRNYILTTAFEHSSVAKTAQMCGYQHIKCPVDKQGFVIKEAYENLLKQHKNKIAIVSIIFAQNEIGTIQNITELCKLARKHLGDDIPFHTDATQIVGKYKIDVERIGVDMLTGSAHKFHGPRGVGLLYCRSKFIDSSCTPITGGGQERGCRSGTENVPGIVSAAVALELMCVNERMMAARMVLVNRMRIEMYNIIRRSVPNIKVNSYEDMEDTLRGMYNILNISFVELTPSDSMTKMLDEAGIVVNSGSACSKGKTSETLLAVGLNEKQALSTLRISLSEFNDMESCREAAREIVRCYRKMHF
jgi:cysteine desulfurase